MDYVCCIPQQNASRLTDRRGISDQVFVKKRTTFVKISGKPVKLGKFVDNKGKKQRFIHLPKSRTWEALEREILGVLCRAYKLCREM